MLDAIKLARALDCLPKRLFFYGIEIGNGEQQIDIEGLVANLITELTML